MTRKQLRIRMSQKNSSVINTLSNLYLGLRVELHELKYKIPLIEETISLIQTMFGAEDRND